MILCGWRVTRRDENDLSVDEVIEQVDFTRERAKAVRTTEFRRAALERIPAGRAKKLHLNLD